VPDVTSARRVAEGVFDCTVVVTVDEGTGDDVRDEATLGLTPSQAAHVWTGPALIRPMLLTRDSRNEVGQELHDREWRGRIPVAAPDIPIGATVTVASVARNGDPLLMGRSFEVVAVGYGSHVVTRILRLAAKTRGPLR
jgi:hypothetical protein